MNTNRIAPVASSAWFWRTIAALEALLIVAAVAIVLASQLQRVVAPSLGASLPAGVNAPPATVHKPIAGCQACADEWLAATQARRAPAALTTDKPVVRLVPSARSVSITHLRVINCQACRDEVLGEAQARLARAATLAGSTSDGSVEEQPVNWRGIHPR
jgi:hypothetical protein